MRFSLVRTPAPGMGGLTRLAALSLLPLLLAAAALGAQTATGNLRGYVTATAGAPVVAATVTARNLDNNQARTTTTNESGFFYVGGLRPGGYEISVRRVGLAPQTRQVQVPIGATVDANFALSETAVTLETVTVTATAPEERTRTSEVGTNVSREQIENLPNFERNFLDVARLAPGITSTNVNSTDKTISAGGQPAEAVNVFIDGATYKNDVLRGGVVGQDASKGNPFPQGAVQEFRVVTQNYKAEYQRAGSAVITATTRSGTNEFEAELFGYAVPKNYVTADAIARRDDRLRPQYKRTQAGASIGGPLVRDRLFFFGTYELNFRDEPANVIFGGDSSRAPAGLLTQLRPYTGGYAQEFREHLGFGKLTWSASDRSTVDVSLNARFDKDYRNFGGQTSLEAAENMKVDTYTGVGNWRWAGDRWLNEMQVSGQSFTWKPTWINGDLVGRNYVGVLRIGGKDTQQDFQQRRLSLRNDVTRGGVQLAGDHVFKFGGNVDFLQYEAGKYLNFNPSFNYRFDENWAYPFEARFGFGDPNIDTDNTQFGVYAQDDWTIGRRLVLNLGVRWDAETNMINNDYATPAPLADSLRGPLNDLLLVERLNSDGSRTPVRVVDELGGLERYIATGDNRPMYKKAIQPRVGASFDVFGTGSTVLFAGWGIYYDRNYWNTLLDEQFRRQYGVYTVQFRATQAECDATDSPSTCTPWNDQYLNPETLRTLSGSVGRPEIFMVANDLTPPSTRQYSAGIRQSIGQTLLTVSYNGVRGRNYMNFVRASGWGALGPNYAQLFVTDDRVRTWYNALQVQLDRPMGESRWGGSIAYTLGKSEEQGQSNDIFWPFDDRAPTVADLPRRRAPGDQRHKIVANGVFRLPADLIVSSIVTLASPITVNATDASRGWDLHQQITYPYTPPARPFLGMGRVFGYQMMDLRVEKPIQLPNGQSVSIVADAFNVFNNANYGCYDATIFPTSGDPNQNFGRPGCAGLGFRMQLGARWNYRSRSSLDE